MEHSKHLIRAFIIILGVGIVLFALRFIEKPDTFGDYGHFRAANLLEQAALPTQHGQINACAECHEEIFETKLASAHAEVSCESCHAPIIEHVRDGEHIAEMPRKKVAALCINCHQLLRARPAKHPQIVVREHLADMDIEWTDEVCYECHSPHDPAEVP